MIKLQVEEYCSNCPEFEPYVDQDVLEYADFNLDEVHKEVNTFVSCKHKDRCKSIVSFIEKEKEHENYI